MACFWNRKFPLAEETTLEMQVFEGSDLYGNINPKGNRL